jgi:hypothetical protein
MKTHLSIHWYYKQARVLALLVLFFTITIQIPTTQAFNYPGKMALIISPQTNTGSENQKGIDTGLENNSESDTISDSSEIEIVLARKAESGRNTEMENDRFYTILSYSLGVVTIVLIIALIYFFINLKDNGKRSKILKKRLEKLSLKKAGQEV